MFACCREVSFILRFKLGRTAKDLGAIDGVSHNENMTTCLISLGSNLGDRDALLDAAVKRLQSQNQIGGFAESRRIQTAPIGGPTGQNLFLNSAARFETTYSPLELLECLQTIERDLGRKREVRWGARVVDLDLLLYGQQIINSLGLHVPHPRMTYRRFVLEPAIEIAPDCIHPASGWTVQELWKNLFSSEDVIVVVGNDLALCERICQAARAKLTASPAAGTRITTADRDFVDKPRLVVQVGVNDKLSSLRFHAPVLDLPAADEGLVVAEVVAAALAMR